MKKFIGLICLIYSGIIIYVWTNDMLKNFLAPNMQIYIKASVFPLIIIGLFLIIKHGKSHFIISDLILLLPLLMIILSGNARLTESLASNKMIRIDNLPINKVDLKDDPKINNEETNNEKENIEEQEIPALTSIDFEIKDNTYEYLANYFTSKPEALKLAGKTIKVKGFVVTNDFMGENYFALGKYAISCCVADATFVGYISKYDTSKIKAGSWYEIEGKLEKTSWPSGNDILVIDVVNINEISSSEEEQYVYPCYSYDDGTCKDLMNYNLN